MKIPSLLPLPWLCLCAAGAALVPAAAMSLDEAETNLANDSFKVREQAEQVLRRAGLDAYDRVERLTHSDDPEVAFRGRACLPIILLDIDDHLPPELAAKLCRIGGFHGQDISPTVAELKALDPPRPMILIGLINHWMFGSTADSARTNSRAAALEQALRAALRGDSVLTDLGRIHPERYQAKTLALVLNNLCKLRPGDVTPVLALYGGWSRSHPQLPQLLDTDGYRLEVARVVNKAPNRVEAMGRIFNFAAGRELSAEQQMAVQKAIEAEFRRADVLANLGQLPVDHYSADTLAMIINGLCQQRTDDLTPVLALYDGWSRSHPQLPELLGTDGYRLELTRETNKIANRIVALRMLLTRGAKGALPPVHAGILRRQLAAYQNEAGQFPVDSLDQATGLFFFSVFGLDQDEQPRLEPYRKFRGRFPEIDKSALASQPLEVLLVLEKSGAGAALDYAMQQSEHSGVILLGGWLHRHPGLIREPLPLPDNPANGAYGYRTVKFFRLFAPYADEAEMKGHPEIAAAFEILAKDRRWMEVAKEARILVAKQRPDR